MSSQSVLGLLMQINADPSQAQAALDSFNKSTGDSLNKLGVAGKKAGEQLDQSLGHGAGLEKAHQAARILEADMGFRLPRAITTMVGDVLPSIGQLTVAFAGIYGVEAIHRLVEFAKQQIDAFNDVAAGAEVMKSVAEENIRLMEEGAKKSEKYARRQIALTMAYIAADEAQQQALQNHEAGQDQILAALIPVVQAYYVWTGHSKELKDLTKRLTGEHKLLDELIKIVGQDEVKLHEEAAKRAEIDAQMVNNDMQRYDMAIEKLRQFQAVVAVAMELDAHRVLVEESQVAALKAALPIYEDIFSVDRSRSQELAAKLIPAINTEATATVHLNAVKAEAIEFSQEWREATEKEIAAMQKHIAVSSQQAVSGLAALVGGRRAQAAVEAVWEVARGIACLAEGAWPPNPAAIVAAGLHFEAAAQYGIMGGTGGGRRSASNYGGDAYGGRGGADDYGSRGRGDRAGRYDPNSLAPGAAGSAVGSGVVIIRGTQAFEDFTAAAVNAAHDRGVVVNATYASRGTPVGH